MIVSFPSRVVLATVVVAALGIGGCANGTYLRGTHLGDGRAVATSADIRMVIASPIEERTTTYTYDAAGNATAAESVVKRRQVNCAEPSPDIAKAVSDAFGGSGALAMALKEPRSGVEGRGEGSAAVSRSYTEAVAQMTERLATIQLLRDGLYRACEAYSNGAISNTTYAVMLSRYDDTMITMLMGELAAGNFGRSLAAIGGTASSKSSSEASLKAAMTRERDAQRNVERSLDASRQAERRLDEAIKKEGADPDTIAQLQTESATRKEELKEAETQHNKATEEFDSAVKAAAESAATSTGIAAGQIAHAQGEAAVGLATLMVDLQKNYLNDHNVDAIKVACLTANDDPELQRTCKELIKFVIDDHKDHPRFGERSLFQEMFIGKPHE
jgi:hypothetical protein